MRVREMRGISGLRWLAGVVAMVVACALTAGGEAWADCKVASVSSVSPATFGIGPYSSSNVPAPSSTTLTFTVRATAVNNSNSNNAECDYRLIFRRTATSPKLTIPSGPVPLPYTATLAGGGMTFAATAPTNPQTQINPQGRMTGSLNGSTPVSMTFSAVLAVTPSAVASAPTASTAYIDHLLVDVYNWPNNPTTANPRAFVGTLNLDLTATVTQSCSIANPQNVTNQVVKVGANGTTPGEMSTAAKPSFDVSCTGRSNVELKSANGAVTRGNVPVASLGTAPGSFRNKIHYSASVNGGAGTVTLNTASAATSGLSAFSNSVLSSSTTTVSITPETITSATPLLAGTYGDTLTISIVPQ
jgi:hypothetical protein